MRSRVIGFVLAVTVVFVAQASPAWAGTTHHQWTDDEGVGSTVGVDDPGTGSHGGGSGGGKPVCTYEVMTGEDAETAERFSQTADGPKKGAEPGAWYRKLCSDDDSIVAGTVVWISERTIDPADVARLALDHAVLPSPQFALNPPIDQIQLVNLPVWLAIAPGSWQPTSATATDGGVTATTTATPSKVTWNMGDGNVVSCNGPGVVYDRNRRDVDQHSDCTYTYRNGSAGRPNNAFTVTATLEWRVTWNATGLPAGAPATGTLGAITRTSTASIRVGEVQALN